MELPKHMKREAASGSSTYKTFYNLEIETKLAAITAYITSCSCIFLVFCEFQVISSLLTRLKLNHRMPSVYELECLRVYAFTSYVLGCWNLSSQGPCNQLALVKDNCWHSQRRGPNGKPTRTLGPGQTDP